MSLLSATRPWGAVGALVLLGAAGCAFEPGEPYGLVSASLDASHREIAERDAGDGFQKLNTDFQVRLTSATLKVDAIELLDSGTDGAVASFDPANPPPGYELCHNGHCHAADGSLVDYEEIAAELARGGGSEPTTVMVLTAGQVDMLSAMPTELECAPSCALPEGYLVLMRLTASQLELRGQVRDSRAEPRIQGAVDWRVSLNLLEPLPIDESTTGDAAAAGESPGVFERRLDLPINEDEPADIAMSIAVPTDTKLFDRVDFSLGSTASQAVIDLNAAAADAARAELRRNVASIDVGVAVAR